MIYFARILFVAVYRAIQQQINLIPIKLTPFKLDIRVNNKNEPKQKEKCTENFFSSTICCTENKSVHLMSPSEMTEYIWKKTRILIAFQPQISILNKDNQQMLEHWIKFCVFYPCNQFHHESKRRTVSSHYGRDQRETHLLSVGAKTMRSFPKSKQLYILSLLYSFFPILNCYHFKTFCIRRFCDIYFRLLISEQYF